LANINIRQINNKNVKQEMFGCKKALSIDKFNNSTRSKDGLMSKKANMSYHQNAKPKTGNCEECYKNKIVKLASFGLLVDKKKTHCSEHKTDVMVALSNLNRGCIMCKESGINKRSSFGLLVDKKQTHCSEHKTDVMVALSNLNRGCIMCKESGIFKKASFGRLFEKKIHCKTHSKPNEYSKNNPKCDSCLQRPFYGEEKVDVIPKRCEEHKRPSDIDMIQRECELCKDSHFIPSTQTRCSGCLGFQVRKEYNRGIKKERYQIC
jgi:hypothetical protein